MPKNKTWTLDIELFGHTYSLNMAQLLIVFIVLLAVSIYFLGQIGMMFVIIGFGVFILLSKYSDRLPQREG